MAKRYSQPQGNAQIDWGNPITRGLVTATLPGMCQSAGAITPTPQYQDGVKQSVSRLGVVARTVANFGVSLGDQPKFNFGTQDFTMFCVVSPVARTGTQVAVGRYNATSGSYWLGYTGGAVAFSVSGVNASCTAPAGVTDTLCGVRSAGSITAYANGVSGSAVAAAGSVTATDILAIGVFGSYNSYFCVGDYALTAIWDRALSKTEILALSANPWQLFAPVARSIWVPVAAGGDTYTLTADSGSFALTGQDTALNFNRTLAADSGSFALTGQDAALTFNRALVADSGSFALTGQDATPTFSRVLSAASGSYALAGQDATLTYTPISGATYTLAAASGSFALAGQGAVLLQNRSLAADSGAFALTGQDATLARGYMMPAQSGDYSVAGQDAALIASRRLAADSEAFALTGQNADLTYTPITGNTYTLSASSGSFVLTGQDAQLLQNRALAADTATYALAGQGAALTYSGSVSAIYPSPSVVLFGTAYGPTGTEYTGTFVAPTAASIATQVRTELAAELLRITEVAKIHGLVQGTNLVVTPTSRTAGDVVQTISGDGVSSSTVSRV